MIKITKLNTPKVDATKYGLSQKYFIAEYKKASLSQIDVSKIKNLNIRLNSLSDLRKVYGFKVVDDLLVDILNSTSIEAPIVIKYPDGVYLYCTNELLLNLYKLLKLKLSVILINLPKNYKEVNLKI